MNTAATILALLSDARFQFLQDDIRKEYAEWAVRALAAYQKNMAAFPDEGKSRDLPKCSVRHMCDGMPISCCSANDYVKTLKAHAASLVVNPDKVRAAADAALEGNKAFYAARVGEKVEILVGKGATIELDLNLHGVLEGRCIARNGDKKVVLYTSLKTNYRYGENSANGDITIYRQVPTIVESAEGFDPVAAEKADEDAKVQTKLDRKDAILKIQAEIKALEKAKRQAEDVHFNLRWTANGGQPSQTEGAPSAEQVKEAAGKAKEAFKVLKGIREQIKTAKAALRAAKESK